MEIIIVSGQWLNVPAEDRALEHACARTKANFVLPVTVIATQTFAVTEETKSKAILQKNGAVVVPRIPNVLCAVVQLTVSAVQTTVIVNVVFVETEDKLFLSLK